MVCVLNVVLFIIQNQNLNEQKDNFLQIYWSFTVKKCFTLIFGISGLMRNIALNFYTFNSYLEMATLVAVLQSESLYIYPLVKQQIFLLQQGDPNIKVFKFANEQLINFTFVNNMNYSESKNFTTTLTSQLLYYETIMYYLVQQDDPYLNNVVSISYNIYQTFDSLDYIYNLTIQDFRDKIDFRKYLLIIQLFVISFVTGIFSLMILPIKVFSQKKREEILRLFSTIQPDKIMSMISAVCRRLEIIEQSEIQKSKIVQSTRNALLVSPKFQSGYKLSPHNIQNQMISYPSPKAETKRLLVNMKKRNISSTNDLPKIQLSLILWILICLICVEFYPVACYIIGEMYLNSFSTSLTFITSIDYLFDNMNSMFTSQSQLTFIICSYIDFTSPGIVAYTQQAKSYSIKTPNLLQNFKEAYNQIKSYKGLGSSDFQDFLIPLIEGDSCETMNSYIQYLTDQNFPIQQCIDSYKGVFQSGVMIAIQKYETLIDTFMSGVDSKSYLNFKMVLAETQLDLPILDENFVIANFFYVLDSVHNFFQILYKNQYDENIFFSTLLIILQMVVLLLVMIFGWRKFYEDLGHQFFSTKQLLDLVDVSILLDNPYVISFFKRNHSA